MDFFESLIARLLIDITDAQNSANKHSVELAREYKNNPELAMFPVPNALVRSFEFKLKFAIGGLIDENKPKLTLSPTPWTKLREDVKLAVTEIFGLLESGRLNIDSLLSESARPLWHSQQAIFHSYVEMTTWNKLQQGFFENFEPQRNKLIFALGEDVFDAIRRVVGPLTASGLSEEWLTHLRDDVMRVLQSSIPDPLYRRESNTKGLQIVYDLQILADADSDVLAGLTMQVDMRNFEWVTEGSTKSNDENYSRLIAH